MLSDSESEGDSIHRLTVNEHYAKAFQFKKEREELDKRMFVLTSNQFTVPDIFVLRLSVKEKYGSDVDEEDEDGSETNSEEAGSEDEYGEELTPAVDAAILRTLAKIKRKDTDIYNADKGIFEGS